MSWFSSLSDSFSGIFQESAEIGLTSRMGDSLFSNNSNELNKFGETMTSSTMSSSFGGYSDSGYSDGGSGSSGF